VKNLVQAHSFAEMLEQTIRRYQNRAIEAAQVIEELIGPARDMREADARGDKLNLSEEELAFYDALETNDSAVKVLGDETLRTIARELVTTVRNNVTMPSRGLGRRRRCYCGRAPARIIRHDHRPVRAKAARRPITTARPIHGTVMQRPRPVRQKELVAFHTTGTPLARRIAQ
jgi:hypothetical protein